MCESPYDVLGMSVYYLLFACVTVTRWVSALCQCEVVRSHVVGVLCVSV